MRTDQDPICRRDDAQRRADVLAQPGLNGIDFIEVDPSDHRILNVFFLRSLPVGAYGLTADLSRITVRGGTRVAGIRAVAAARRVAPDGTFYLEVRVDRPGDFSPYTLALDAGQLDSFFRRIRFSFMAACAVQFDCRPDDTCPPAPVEEPLLDYLAKDYTSFRRMLLDLLPRLNPDFVERNPSDLGIALVELLAYEGDRLSYFQDAVANEAFLETVRQRLSARRLARLVDYRMHDGRNAATWVHVRVSQACSVELGTRVVSRIGTALVGQTAVPGPEIDDALITADAVATDPALAGAAVFETTHGQRLDPANNEVRIHAWGNEECCFDPGAQEAYLYSVQPSGTAVRPALAKGDFLLFEEVRGPLTGAAADADPGHRQVVVVDEDPEPTTDGIYGDTLVGDALVRFGPGDQPLPLLRVHWGRTDVLRFPLCLSARPRHAELLPNVSVARGNIVLADHGLTASETVPPAGPRFTLTLSRRPLTIQCQPSSVELDPASGRLRTERRDLSCGADQAHPAINLLVTFPTGTELWTAVPDVLDSSPFDQHFVAEVDDEGGARLRFGDGEYGRDPAGATSFEAVYRVGTGRSGNVGAESLAHIALPGGAAAAGKVLGVRNPLPATGGIDRETIEQVRRLAPEAFRAEQFRAVTEDDYARAARKVPEVDSAMASFRWTGSWYTVFVGIDPADPADLVPLPNGRVRLSSGLERKVRAFLTRYRLAGYDLEVRPPRFVPIELALDVCAAPGYFRFDVARAVTNALGSRVLPDGRLGFFHPRNFGFGGAVYLSQIYAAVERVEGVDSLVVKRFRRFGQRDNGELAAGVLPIAPAEIAQLDNDPSFMEHGVLEVTALGGKA